MRIVAPKPPPISLANSFRTEVTPRQPMDDDTTEPGIVDTFAAKVIKPIKWTLLEHIEVELAVTTNLEAMFDLHFKCLVCDEMEGYFIRGVGHTAEKNCEHILDEFVKRHMLCPAVNTVAADVIQEIRAVQLPGAENPTEVDEEMEEMRAAPEETDPCSSLN